MTKPISLDLNCDLGEGAGHDAELMPLITSANIACGAHAGDEATMRATVKLAEKHEVAIGAHPGFADPEHFGRREIALPASALRQLIVDQVTALGRLARLRHVKPHGALYNLAARDRSVAETVAAAIRDVDSALILFALAGSELCSAGQRAGLRVAEEVFADRTYQRDGSLTPRSRGDAMITEEGVAVAQVLKMVAHGTVRATDDCEVPIRADTLCLHGDGIHAVAFARQLRVALLHAGVAVRVFGT